MFINGNYHEVDFSYPNSRPLLTLERTGGKSLGRCFAATYFRVTSTSRLSKEAILGIRKNTSLLGYGQGFYIRSQCDGKEAPAGQDEVPCVMYDRHTRAVIPGEAVNPYSGKPYGTTKYDYFVYECEDHCDSGD